MKPILQPLADWNLPFCNLILFFTKKSFTDDSGMHFALALTGSVAM